MHNLPFAFCPCAITVCCGKVYKFQIISYSYLPNQWKFIRILSYPITLIYTHTLRSVGFLWKRDRPVAEPST